MRPGLLFIAIMFVHVWASAVDAVAQSGGKKSLHAFLATGKESKPTTTFSADVSTIYVFWKAEALEVGDKLDAAWIAEQIVDDASKESKIREAHVRIYKPEEARDGSFSLSRPPGRNWPVGRYRVEIHINGGLAELVKFTITPAVTIEVH